MQSSQPQSSQFQGFRKTTVWPFHFLTPPTNHRLVAHNTVTQWYKPPAPRADKLDRHSHRGENQAGLIPFKAAVSPAGHTQVYQGHQTAERAQVGPRGVDRGLARVSSRPV